MKMNTVHRATRNSLSFVINHTLLRAFDSKILGSEMRKDGKNFASFFVKQDKDDWKKRSLH